MRISMIASCELENGIGIAGKIPWKISSDLRRFREITSGHHLIVGRRTYASFPPTIEMHSRSVLVVSKNVKHLPTLEDALDIARAAGEKEVFIAGGQELYHSALAIATRIYLTQVNASIICDRFFPTPDSWWWRQSGTSLFKAGDGARDQYDSVFTIFERFEVAGDL